MRDASDEHSSTIEPYASVQPKDWTDTAEMLHGSFDRIRNRLAALRGQLWVTPAIMCLLAAVSARAVTWIDDNPIFLDFSAWWYFGGEPETARELLGTLLSGMITMTSLVISITMVVLSLAANQLGPRLIWNFIRDRQIQIVIGVFFSTIIFILIGIRSIRSDDVPDLAVTVATMLVGICLFALLFYVHKIARSIIADTVIDEVAAELLRAIETMFPIEADARRADDPPDQACRRTLCLRKSGYLQVVEYDRLLRVAERRSLTVLIDVRPGQFVLASGEHGLVGSDEPISDAAIEDLRKSFLVGSQRTPTQDVEYSIRQLVEIAVRALSPGTNDPFTAVTVIHRLAASIESLMQRHVVESIRLADSKGSTRVLGVTSTFGGMVDVALNQVRQAAAARGNAAVIITITSVLGDLAAGARTDPHRAALSKHLGAMRRAALRSIDDPADLGDFEAAARKAEHALSTADRSPA